MGDSFSLRSLVIDASADPLVRNLGTLAAGEFGEIGRKDNQLIYRTGRFDQLG